MGECCMSDRRLCGNKAESSIQWMKGRGQRAEGRGQRAEGRGQRAEGRGQRAKLRTQNFSSLISHPPLLPLPFSCLLFNPLLNRAFTLRMFYSNRSEVASVNRSGLAIGGLFILWHGVVWKNV